MVPVASIRYFRFIPGQKPTANPAERIAVGKEEQGSGRMTFFCSIGIKEERRSKADFAPTWKARTVSRLQFSGLHPNPNRSPAKRVRFGKEEQRNERALTFEKSRSKRYAACSDVVPVAGLEPARHRWQWILSPPRLPIPTHRLSPLTIPQFPWKFKRFFHRRFDTYFVTSSRSPSSVRRAVSPECSVPSSSCSATASSSFSWRHRRRGRAPYLGS